VSGSAGHRGESVDAAGVVIATRNRRDVLLRTLARLTALPERPPIVVVDNASGDGTAAAAREAFPAVEVLSLSSNRGAFARNLGVDRLDTPIVAFCDDDSWWEPGSLARAGELFRRFPSLGLLAAHIVVGRERRLDPTAARMLGAPAPGLPGPRVQGFLACGAIVRRAAFLEAHGFCERFLIGSEEELLAIDMRRAGWDLCYANDVVAVHMPDGGGRDDRPWLSRRNALWTSWLRMPLRRALRQTATTAREAAGDPAARRALATALRGLPWALRHRRLYG
jgi:GT2 family glycosyltransferase